MAKTNWAKVRAIQRSKALKRPAFQPQTPMSSGGMVTFAPNHSGKHDAGIVTQVKDSDTSLVNKAFVDDVRDYVEEVATRQTVELFLTTNASDITDYDDLDIDVSPDAEDTIQETITANSSTLINAFASQLDEAEIDALEILERGIYDLHLHALADFPNGMTIYFEFIHRTAGGTETLLGTSHDSDLLGLTERQIDLHAYISTDKQFTAGDRVVVKVYGRNTNAASKDITIHVEGDTISRVEFPGFISPTFVPAHNHTHASTTGRTETDHHDNSDDHAPGSDDQDISGIAVNASDIVSVSSSVSFNTADIVSVSSSVSFNTADIVSVSAQTEQNRIEIGTNTSNIALNTTHRSSDGTDHEDVVFNTADIVSVSSGVSSNTASITLNTNDIVSVSSKVSFNTADIVSVSSKASFNEADIVSVSAALRGDVMADSEHRHSELSASDGTPDPAMSADALGHVTFFSGMNHAVQTLGQDTDDWDTKGINVLFITSVDDPITIGGFSNGVSGQVLHLIKIDNDNAIIVEHGEVSGEQSIIMPDAADFTFNAAYASGGMTLVCDGRAWYAVSVWG